jgi:hypothetical protein
MSIVIDGTGTISGVSATGISSAQTVTSVPSSALPAGTVLQVVQTVVNSAQTYSFGSFPNWQAVTGLSVSITPRSSSSKILVMLDLKGGPTAAGMISARLERGGTPIYVASSGTAQASTAMVYFNGSTVGTGAMVATYLDSPATTSSTTYIASVVADASSTAYVNRDSRNSSGSDPLTTSSITVMEIAA